MPLAEGLNSRIVYKFYSSGVINPAVDPDTSTDPGASGGQTIRRVSSSLSLGKDTFQSGEIRSDRQISDFRHGARRVSGDIAGELSPLTWRDFISALFRGNWATTASLAPGAITSVASDATAGTFTLTAGDAVALGLRVGSIIAPSGWTGAGVPFNTTRYVITAMSGTGGRTLTVYPKPSATVAAQTTVTLAVPGGRIANPSSGFVNRKLAVEINADDLDVSRLFTELRVNSMNIGLPPNGMATVGFGLTGRNMKVLTGAAAPYFTAPTAETGTPVLASPNGLLLVNGAVAGVTTGLDMTVDLPVEANPVVGQNLVADIILGRFNLTGNMTAYFDSEINLNYFLNETEISLLTWVTGGSGASDPGMTIFVPRLKFGNADTPTQGEGGQMVTLPFQALKGKTAVTVAPLGVGDITMQIVDTEYAP